MITETVISVPIPGKEESYQVDMQEYYLVEHKLGNFASMSLMDTQIIKSDLYKATLSLGRILDRTQRLLDEAKAMVKTRKAVLTIDIIPEVLGSRKLTSNESNREAVIELDPEYRNLYHVQTDISTTRETLWLLYQRLVQAINSVESTAFQMSKIQGNPNPHLTTTLSTDNSQVTDEPPNSSGGAYRYSRGARNGR